MFNLLGRALPASLLIVDVALASPLAAQESGEGGIVTEPLEPLEPATDGEGESGTSGNSRFKPAPFRTLEIPQQPELIEPVETAAQLGARMRLLDKMTGRIQTVEIDSGTDQMVDRLRIRIEACRAPQDNAQHGTMAFVQIWDT